MGLVELIAIANLTWRGIALIVDLRKEWAAGRFNPETVKTTVAAAEKAYAEFVAAYPDDGKAKNLKLEFDYANKAVNYLLNDDNMAVLLSKADSLMAYINRQVDRQYHEYLNRSEVRLQQWRDDKKNGKGNTLADLMKVVPVLLFVLLLSGCWLGAKPNSDNVIRAEGVMLRYSPDGKWLDVEFDDRITSSGIRLDLGPPIALGVELPE